MTLSILPARTLRLVAAPVVAICVMLAVGAAPARAQYGGVSGLFVTTSPATPGFADFTGLGCEGGVEVVLYLPGIVPTSADPPSSQTVPGRVLAVTTSVASPGDVADGTFAFPDVLLPTDLEPGTYRVQSRCGDVVLEVLIHLASDGTVRYEPDTGTPTLNEIPDALPFTGRDSSRLLSVGAAFVVIGVSLATMARRFSATTSR